VFQSFIFHDNNLIIINELITGWIFLILDEEHIATTDLLLSFSNHVNFSTLSSLLNSMSAIIWEDFIKSRIRPVSDRKATIIIKIEGLLTNNEINEHAII